MNAKVNNKYHNNELRIHFVKMNVFTVLLCDNITIEHICLGF